MSYVGAGRREMSGLLFLYVITIFFRVVSVTVDMILCPINVNKFNVIFTYSVNID